jgi:hypothetical protein
MDDACVIAKKHWLLNCKSAIFAFKFSVEIPQHKASFRYWHNNNGRIRL